MMPATFVYFYLGQRAPRYIDVFLIVLGIIVAGAVVTAVVQRRRRGKLVP